MVGVGQGAQHDIEDRIAELGTNVIMVMPEASRLGGVSRGAGSSSSLTLEDVEHIRERAENVSFVSPIVQVVAQIIAGSNNWSTQVYGAEPAYLQIRDWEVEAGALFTERDGISRAKVAVLGHTVAEELFPGQTAVGSRIRINNTPFTVVGVLEAKGQRAVGMDQDDIVIVPASTALYRLSGGDTIHQIYVSATSEATIDKAQRQITSVLRLAHEIAPGMDDDFVIRTQTEITEMFSATTRTLTLLLGSIASVSLIVGGIGIMNIMLVSVTERTREIGIRLAVGARGTDVLSQFLIEAILLSVLGGIIGVLVSFGVALGLSRFIALRTVIMPGIVLLALGFSAAVGVFFGYYPARKAAALDPIEALRYE
jgi:putative ABC transport system permease protein